MTSEPFSGYTGRGVSVAMIDSGVNPAHPHVGGVAGGVRIGPHGPVPGEGYLDYNGHGTAVAGAIREKAPDALLYPVKVFDQRLTTNVETIIRAIEWAIDEQIQIINLSLGTTNAAHKENLERAVGRAAQKNVVLVAAYAAEGERSLPGCLPLVIGVDADLKQPRESYRVTEVDGDVVFLASAYPRDIPGVARERNLSGISFAVANMTGFVARAREAHPQALVASLKQLLNLQESLRPIPGCDCR